MQGPHSPVRTTPTPAIKGNRKPHRSVFGQFKTPVKFGALLGLLACLTLFSACEMPMGKITPLREPPLIPSPPDAPVQGEAPQTAHVASYADTADIQNFSPALAQAVNRALSLSVLKPATPESRFEPDKPIGYGEFRQWANDYQNAVNTARNQATATAISPDSPPPAGGPLSPPPALTAITQTWLPSEMMWGAQGVREKTTLTREALCALAVFLNGQDAQARKLTPAQIAKAQPGQDGQDGMSNPDDADLTDGTLSQLSDYGKISPWALKYVALSYKNDWLEPLFGLSPAKIVADDGFHPAQPVTRGEAMLLLDQLFGQQAATSASGASTGQSSTSANATGDSGSVSGSGTPSQSQGSQPSVSPGKATGRTEQPIPLGRLQSVRESSPQGSRQGLRVTGPE